MQSIISAPPFSAARATPARLALDYITLDNRLQSRKLRPSVVQDYLKALRRGEELPPVLVVRDANGNYYLIDGFHRVAATREQVGIDDIAVTIIDGTFEDALWLSWGANRNHGFRRTQKDVRRAIHAALNHPRWSLESDRAIAQHIGCDHKTVGAMRRMCAGGEFPTGGQTGPTKSKILAACRLLAKVRPEQARQFNREELATVRAGYEPLHRLLFGASTLRPQKSTVQEESSEKGVTLNGKPN